MSIWKIFHIWELLCQKVLYSLHILLPFDRLANIGFSGDILMGHLFLHLKGTFQYYVDVSNIATFREYLLILDKFLLIHLPVETSDLTVRQSFERWQLLDEIDHFTLNLISHLQQRVLVSFSRQVCKLTSIFSFHGHNLIASALQGLLAKGIAFF